MLKIKGHQSNVTVTLAKMARPAMVAGSPAITAVGTRSAAWVLRACEIPGFRV